MNSKYKAGEALTEWLTTLTDEGIQEKYPAGEIAPDYQKVRIPIPSNLSTEAKNYLELCYREDEQAKFYMDLEFANLHEGKAGGWVLFGRISDDRDNWCSFNGITYNRDLEIKIIKLYLGEDAPYKMDNSKSPEAGIEDYLMNNGLEG